MAGIFDFDDAENPFAGYSFVYVPYCTGDVHLGDATHEYSPDLTVEHGGWVNGDAARQLPRRAVRRRRAGRRRRRERRVDRRRRSTPGSYRDVLPEAQITVLRRRLGRLPGQPALNAGIGGLWGTSDDAGHGRSTRYRRGVGHPALLGAGRAARSRDRDVSFRLRLRRGAGGIHAAHRGRTRPTWAASIDANEATIEAAGVDQHSFTAPGNDHTLVAQATSSTRWRSTASARRLGDRRDRRRGRRRRHCEECEAPSPATTG